MIMFLQVRGVLVSHDLVPSSKVLCCVAVSLSDSHVRLQVVITSNYVVLDVRLQVDITSNYVMLDALV
jgi:hypothetical protein